MKEKFWRCRAMGHWRAGEQRKGVKIRRGRLKDYSKTEIRCFYQGFSITRFFFHVSCLSRWKGNR